MIDLSDPISRQQTITALRALSDEDGYINVPHEVVTDVVRGLPPVRAEHEQTTQSERGESDKLGVKTGETYKDTISRQAAIDAPTIKPEQQWILCSERLPENNRQVLVYARSVHFALAKYDEMREADGTYKMQWVTFDAWKPFYKIKEVVAWMPLPEPYQEGEQDDSISD